MYKYTGDSILNASFTVQVPKPLDNRTVVANIYELYSIPPKYAYEGMTVANIDNGNIYMLVNKSKIGEKAGWKASYESIQIITCELNEYKEWKANTDELLQPIDPLKEYLHRDTYYYIYEDSLNGQEELQEYVRRSDWMELLNEVTNNRAQVGQLIAAIRSEYSTLEYVNNTFAPLTMFDKDNPESFISNLISEYYTKEEANNTFVTIESLKIENQFIFVTSEKYNLDKEAYEQYKQGIAEQLTHFIVTDSNASLNKLVVGQIISPTAGGQKLVIDVTAEGLKVGDKKYAFLNDIPNLITVTKAEYEQLIANNELINDAYYYITGEEDSYVLRSELERDYYNSNCTLTEDKIVLEKYLDINGDEDIRVLKHAFLNSYFQTGLRGNIDEAVIKRALDNNLEGLKKEYIKVDEIPFDFSRRRLSVIINDGKNNQIITKGAVEEILEICTQVDYKGQVSQITREIKENILKISKSLNKEGLRVIAICQKNDNTKNDFSVADEKNMILLGFIGFLDPPKLSAKESISKLSKAGIKVMVLTR